MPSQCIDFVRCLRDGGILGLLVFRLLMNACSLTAKKRRERGSTTKGRSCVALTTTWQFMAGDHDILRVVLVLFTAASQLLLA